MQWLCELENPLLTFELYPVLLRAQKQGDELRRQGDIIAALKQLPPGNKVVLSLLLDVWYQVHQHSEKNKMPSSSLAIILGPTLLRDKDQNKQTPEQLATSQTDIKTCIRLVDNLISDAPLYRQKVLDEVVAQPPKKVSTPPPKLAIPDKLSSSNHSGPLSPLSPLSPTTKKKKMFGLSSYAGGTGSGEVSKDKDKSKKKKATNWDDPDRIVKPDDHESLANLRTILEDKVTHDAFMTYLREKEFSDENLLFYESVDKYKSLPGADRPKFLRQLVKEFIGQDSTYQVNIDSDCRREIEEALERAENDSENAELTDNLLDEARSFIFRLIEEHSYPRFLQSPQCRNMLKTRDP